MNKIISISAKCSDLFTATLMTKEEGPIGEDYDGYVPDFFPEEHYGDYVMLNIDVETGQILNWKKPTEKELREIFKY